MLCLYEPAKELCVSITLYDQHGNRHYNILYQTTPVLLHLLYPFRVVVK